ncbi:MAG: 3-oxoacyl-[acyl-carrier-protein] synthase III C-terminal domain-containing protein, partial [Rhodoluna sp.]
IKTGDTESQVRLLKIPAGKPVPEHSHGGRELTLVLKGAFSDGATVFKWAVWEMVKVAKEALEVAGVKAEDLAAIVTHQANIRIIDELAKQLEVPSGVVIAR